MLTLAWIIAAGSCALAALLGWRLRTRRRELQALASAHTRDRAHEELLHGLLDASPVAMILCTEGGQILVDNEAARRLFFEGRPGQGQNFLRLVANGPSELQGPLLRASDELVELSVAGERESYHFARRRFEHLGEPHTLLVVRPMTREVARHDLAVLKSVVRLLSHEVNNSLAPVSSLLHSSRHILASGERLERLASVLDTIEERTRHLSDFIAGYAGLARLPRPVPRSASWSELCERLGLLFPSLQREVPAGAQGFFDPGQLEQALINLLKNAQEADGQAGTVRLEVAPLADQAAELRVLDRGRGFSADELEQALLPFYTTKPGGSGVGLALVREIVHAHGGRLMLGAREGGGAAVRVFLPGPKPRPELDRARLTLTRN
jgi:nitrogen fixation/metabolism regulation signal transduction histidine kinase